MGNVILREPWRRMDLGGGSFDPCARLPPPRSFRLAELALRMTISGDGSLVHKCRRSAVYSPDALAALVSVLPPLALELSDDDDFSALPSP
ncbi:MAG TPA: hypothetical protein VFE33_14155, partial [Thermoanaerobaculia bacterium]|nr:hypothetical protein [Thermoanaerobaculia bacterium]